MTAEAEPSGVTGPRPVTPLGILAAELGKVRDALAGLDGVAPEVRSGIDRAWELANGLDPYLSRCTTPESPAQRSLAERTAQEDWDRYGDGHHLEREMLSGHVEGQMLKFLVYVSGARRVLDIGMFSGYSALSMAEALPDDGEVVACELDPDVAALARRSFDESPDGHKITVRVGPARRTLEDLADGGSTFDLAFVDADKAGYRDYLDLLLERRLLSGRGAVCVDNTLLQGEPYVSGAPSANGAAIAEFNRWVAEDPRVEQVLVPLRDGLTLIRPVASRRA